jgi:hypothetical protein
VPGPLHVHAQRLGADARVLQYAFVVADEAGAEVARGRATIVLAADSS